MDVWLTTEVMAIIVIFWPILEKNWLPGKPPVMSNRILVISRRNAFICIHTIFVPKLAAMVTPLVPCVQECHR